MKSPGVGFGIMILNNGKVLLGKRHSDPAKADSELHGEGTWTMPGGKLNYKEELEDGACREILEETGMEIAKEKLEMISVTNNIVEDVHFVTIGFLYKDAVDEPKVMEPDEITEWKWFDLKNLPSPLFFPSKQILNKYLSQK